MILVVNQDDLATSFRTLVYEFIFVLDRNYAKLIMF